eukprot:XP_019928624.1 PREDICTED: metalloproteinase inhibitor 2-like isoform X2 [Crassostrea gigas]
MMLLSALVLLWAVVTEVWSCTCFPTHVQDQFCRAQIVLVATVKGSEEIYQNSIIKAPNTRDPENPYEMMPVERKYKVRIHRFFKGEELLGGKGKRVKYIHTSASGAACGLHLNKGKTYILSARIQRQGEIWSSMCDWVQTFKTLNRHQLKGIKFHYRRNCKCSISWCLGNNRCGDFFVRCLGAWAVIVDFLLFFFRCLDARAIIVVFILLDVLVPGH